MKPHSAFKMVLIGASLRDGNRGVCALADATIGLISQARPGARITLYASDRKATEPVVEVGDISVGMLTYRLSFEGGLNQSLPWLVLVAAAYRLIPSRTLRRRLTASYPAIRAIAEADVVGSLWAGDSFSDIYGMSRYLKRLLPHLLVTLLGTKILLLPQTFGPFESPTAKRLARWLFKRSDQVCARDAESLDVARDLLRDAGSGVAPLLSPDVAFSLVARRPSPLPIQPPLPAATSPLLIGLNPSGLLSIGGYTGQNMFDLRSPYVETMRSLVKTLIQRFDARILFVPHVFGTGVESDEPACRDLYDWASANHADRVHLVRGRWDQRELKGIIGLCDVFIGARMHACIAALSQGVPAIGIAYSRKFRGVFESADVIDLVVDPRRLDMKALIDTCCDRIENRASAKLRLANRLPQLQTELKSQFDLMLGVDAHAATRSDE